jgi:hypothetical protein
VLVISGVLVFIMVNVLMPVLGRLVTRLSASRYRLARSGRTAGDRRSTDS